MLSKEIIALFQQITKETGKLVAGFVDKEDLTGVADFASIYPKSPIECNTLTKELELNGTIADVLPTGNYYWLNAPLETEIGLIRRCSVAVYNAEYTERGYCDFEPKDFKAFKAKYFERKHFSLFDHPNFELIELRAPGYNVRAYFPNSFE